MVVAQIIFAFGVYVKQFGKYGIMMSGDEYKKEWEINMSKVEEKMKDYNLKMTQKMEEEVGISEEQRSFEEKKENGEYKIYIEKITIP